MDVLMDGIVFGESPRWRDGRLWFSDWGSGRVYSVTPDGTPTVEVEVVSFPMCIDSTRTSAADPSRRRPRHREALQKAAGSATNLTQPVADSRRH